MGIVAIREIFFGQIGRNGEGSVRRYSTEPETEAALEERPQTDEIPAEDPGEPTTVGNEPEGIEAAYNVTGVRRKELVAAVGDFIGAKPEYLRAPTYAFAVGSYNIDREGTLTGPRKIQR